MCLTPITLCCGCSNYLDIEINKQKCVEYYITLFVLPVIPLYLTVHCTFKLRNLSPTSKFQHSTDGVEGCRN